MTETTQANRFGPPKSGKRLIDLDDTPTRSFLLGYQVMNRVPSMGPLFVSTGGVDDGDEKERLTLSTDV